MCTLSVGVVSRLTSISNGIPHKQWWGHHETGTSHVTILKSALAAFLYVIWTVYLPNDLISTGKNVLQI